MPPLLEGDLMAATCLIEPHGAIPGVCADHATWLHGPGEDRGEAGGRDILRLTHQTDEGRLGTNHTRVAGHPRVRPEPHGRRVLGILEDIPCDGWAVVAAPRRTPVSRWSMRSAPPAAGGQVTAKSRW